MSTIAQNLIPVAVHKSINSGCHFHNTPFHGTLPPEACRIVVTSSAVSLATLISLIRHLYLIEMWLGENQRIRIKETYI